MTSTASLCSEAARSRARNRVRRQPAVGVAGSASFGPAVRRFTTAGTAISPIHAKPSALQARQRSARQNIRLYLARDGSGVGPGAYSRVPSPRPPTAPVLPLHAIRPSMTCSKSTTSSRGQVSGDSIAVNGKRPASRLSVMPAIRCSATAELRGIPRLPGRPAPRSACRSRCSAQAQ